MVSCIARRLSSVAIAVLMCAASPALADQAVFGAGSFRAMEPVFDEVRGVTKTEPGYAGGVSANPNHKNAEDNGHIEVVRITFDPKLVPYEHLLEVYWANVDPVDEEGQFCDEGARFTPVIFTMDDEQDRLAKIASQRVQENYLNWQEVHVAIRRLNEFYPAESEFQDYYQKSKMGYKFYNFRCGRERRLSDLWDGADSLNLFSEATVR